MEPAFPDSPKRRTPWSTLSARVITVVSRKGGVGKTTSAVNLGAAFALSGHSVLIVGTDPQCGVAPILGTRVDRLAGGLIDLWDHDANLTELAHPSPLKNLFFVSPRLLNLDDEGRYLKHLEERPDVFIEQIDRARNLYDTIIIDCPPHLGPPTRAAVVAADGLLVPAQAEELCRDSLGALLGALESIKDDNGLVDLEGPELDGIFLTMYSEHTRMGRHVAAKVAEEFGPILFDTAVPRTTRLSEMALRGKPSVIYDRRSPGSRAYFNLADEMLERYRLRTGTEHAGAGPGLEQARHGRDLATGITSSASRPSLSSPPDDHLTGGGLDRLLGDLRAAGNLRVPSAPGAQDFSDEDLVSLDDLLAEEERSSNERWDSGWRDPSERAN